MSCRKFALQALQFHPVRVITRCCGEVVEQCDVDTVQWYNFQAWVWVLSLELTRGEWQGV